MTSSYKLYAFDMDGTLLDSMPYWRLCNVEFLLKHGLEYRRELMADALFNSNRVMLPRYIEAYGLKGSLEDYYAEYERLMIKHYQSDIKAKPFAAEYLKRLKAGGARICVATATSVPIASDALEHAGLAGLVDEVVDPHIIGCTKSDKAFFVRLAARYGIACADICMAEDALYAVKSAKAAGCAVLAVRDLQSEPAREEIERLCDKYICSYKELLMD